MMFSLVFAGISRINYQTFNGIVHGLDAKKEKNINIRTLKVVILISCEFSIIGGYQRVFRWAQQGVLFHGKAPSFFYDIKDEIYKVYRLICWYYSRLVIDKVLEKIC